MLKLNDAVKNVALVLSEFRGTVNGAVMTAKEHIVVSESFRLIVNTAREAEELKAEKKENEVDINADIEKENSRE